MPWGGLSTLPTIGFMCHQWRPAVVVVFVALHARHHADNVSGNTFAGCDSASISLCSCHIVACALSSWPYERVIEDLIIALVQRIKRGPGFKITVGLSAGC